jgi:outer membrane autotransporter protein
MDAMMTAVEGGRGVNVFGTIGGGDMKVSTGSHVHVHGVNMVAGAGYGRAAPFGDFTAGVFFEYGRGGYGTENDFDSGSLGSSGNTHYAGGGVMGRMDLTHFETRLGFPYVEASFRAGRVFNNYESSDLAQQLQIDGLDKANYSESASYLGAHIGAGFMFFLPSKFRLDAYVKGFWTRVGGKTFALKDADRTLAFKATNSERARVGGRLYYDATEAVSPYIGLAYEYAFNGKANATLDGYQIDAPQMKGSTGIGEVGVRYEPENFDSKLALDVSASGYAGKRRGVSGTLKLRYAF